MKKNIAETLLWLCSIDSPIGEEETLFRAVLERALGSVPMAKPIVSKNSFVLPASRGTKGPHIALVGHLDTVRTENGPARIDGNRVFGSGASDMKSGLAIMLHLLEDYPEILKEIDLSLVFYSREEGPFLENELGPLLDVWHDKSTVDLAVCLEPSDNKVHLGCCGSLHATISFRGKTGHSARPWEGVSAVTKALPFLSRLASLKPEEHEIDGMIYRRVTTATKINDGGRGRNIVPDLVTINVNHRFPPCFSVEDSCHYLQELVSGEGEIEFTDLSPGALPRSNHPLVKALLHTPGVKEVTSKQAWTDVARFSAINIPAINFGPGENAQAHQKNESTDIKLLEEGLEIFKTWLFSVAKKESNPLT